MAAGGVSISVLVWRGAVVSQAAVVCVTEKPRGEAVLLCCAGDGARGAVVILVWR